MAHSDAVGDSVSLPNYAGELFTIGQLKTPLLTMCGGLTGGGIVTTDVFPMGNFLTLDAASENFTVSETASQTAPDSDIYAASQNTNFIQIVQRKIELTYKSQAMTGLISGQAVVNMGVARVNSMQTQRMAHLLQLAKDTNWSMHRGTGTTPATAATDAKMRGVITAVNADSSTEKDATDGALTKALMEALEKLILDQTDGMDNPVIFTGAYQVQALNRLYGYAPESIVIGGVTLKTINLPVLGPVGVVYDSAVPTSTLALYDVAKITPVFLVTPGKPPVFFEPLAKSGAAELQQLCTMISVDYGHADYHGTIINLATS